MALSRQVRPFCHRPGKGFFDTVKKLEVRQHIFVCLKAELFSPEWSEAIIPGCLPGQPQHDALLIMMAVGQTLKQNFSNNSMATI